MVERFVVEHFGRDSSGCPTGFLVRDKKTGKAVSHWLPNDSTPYDHCRLLARDEADRLNDSENRLRRNSRQRVYHKARTEAYRSAGMVRTKYGWE